MSAYVRTIRRMVDLLIIIGCTLVFAACVWRFNEWVLARNAERARLLDDAEAQHRAVMNDDPEAVYGRFPVPDLNQQPRREPPDIGFAG